MYPIHPLAAAIPEMTEDQFNTLVASIQYAGQHDPALLHNGHIIDGRHRQKACNLLGITLKTTEWIPQSDDHDAELNALIDAKNNARRHLTPSQQALAAAKFYATTKGKKPITQKQAAEEKGVSIRQLERAIAITKNASPDVVAKVEAGELPLIDAEREIQKPPQRRKTHKPNHRKLNRQLISKTDAEIDNLDTTGTQPNPQINATTPDNQEFESLVILKLHDLKAATIASQSQQHRIQHLINTWNNSKSSNCLRRNTKNADDQTT